MRLVALLLCSLLLAGPASADGDTAREFDSYVLSLSWAPNWCAMTGDSRGDPECVKHGLTFTLHGLWPQNDDGSHPSGCRTSASDPSRGDTAALEDIMGSAGLAWHEWQTHGRCSGLSSDAYLALMRKAYASVIIPPVFARIRQPLQIAPKVVQDAFLESNPNLTHRAIAVTCDRAMIQEVRICLTKDLVPRDCGGQIRGCTMSVVELDAVR